MQSGHVIELGVTTAVVLRWFRDMIKCLSLKLLTAIATSFDTIISHDVARVSNKICSWMLSDNRVIIPGGCWNSSTGLGIYIITLDNLNAL